MLLRSERRPHVGEDEHDYADHWLRPLVDHRAPAALDRTNAEHGRQPREVDLPGKELLQEVGIRVGDDQQRMTPSRS